MVIRTYIDKDNTIVKDSCVNTGRNEIAELFHGGHPSITKYSRHLFYFDVSDLQAKYECGILGDLSKVTHTLKMTNTSCFDDDLLGKKTCHGFQRACSFDLNLFRIGQPWDEGCGYDYELAKTQQNDEIAFVEGPSNWYNSRSRTEWEFEGVYTGCPEDITVTTQHFDKGNENIVMDITDEVNSLITGGTDNYGYGLSFERRLETLLLKQSQFVGFFTKETQTYYEPFVETIYDNPIKDDRDRFYRCKDNKLYLYVNIGGQPANLDENPALRIEDDAGNLVVAFTPDQITKVSKGVYCADVRIDDTSSDCAFYTDIWKNIIIDGKVREDVILDFEVKDAEDYFDVGLYEVDSVDYNLTVSGIKRDECIKRGDQRRVFVTARKAFTINESDVIDGLQYRVYVKEGPAQVTVIDWQDVNRTFNKNYFIIDTSWMIPNVYYIDVRLSSNHEVKTFCDATKFQIVNEVIIK